MRPPVSLSNITNKLEVLFGLEQIRGLSNITNKRCYLDWKKLEPAASMAQMKTQFGQAVLYNPPRMPYWIFGVCHLIMGSHFVDR